MPPPFGTGNLGDLDHRDAAIAAGQDRRGSVPPLDRRRVRRPVVSGARSKLVALSSRVDAATNVTEHAASSAQAPASAPSGTTSNDSNAELLAQIRMLRADLSEGICASAGVQLLIARWQVQELRLMHLDRQRAATASKRLEEARLRTRCAEQLGHMEHRLIRSSSPNDRRQGVEAAIDGLKARIASHQATEKSLRSEEQALLNLMSTEQVRWRDVNSRLDELERRLSGGVTWPFSLADRTVTQRRVGYQMVPRQRKSGRKRADRGSV
jgi:hypothetical protein